jgi:hypothetical protein
MFTIIGGDGKEYGPVSLQQLREWVAAGRANMDTQAKVAGTEEWRRLGDFPEFATGATSVPPPLQSSSPIAVAGPVNPSMFAADLISRADKLDIFSCLDRSFQLWKANFLPLVGVTLLVLITQMAVNMVPVIGSIAGVFLSGVFYGGLYYYYLGKMRGEPRTVGDAFAGFSRGLGSLVLASFLTAFLSLVAAMLFFGPIFWPFMKAAIAGAAAGSAPATLDFPDLTPLMGVGLLAGFLLLVYLSVSWIFSFALIVDQGLGGWSAMEVSRRVITKQWFRVFCVALLGGILALLGIVGFFVGIFLTLPLAFGAILYAYEDLCNPPLHSAAGS